MARNTRTFSDIDLNFVPAPIYLVKNDGIGLLTCSTTSPIVTGTRTTFTTYNMVERNLWIGTTFIGKVKSITSDTKLVMYHNANANFSGQTYKYSYGADLVKKYDDQAIKTAVKNLILTNNYERPFHPEIGSQVNALLFEPATPLLKAVLEKTIRNTIENFEPRVNLTDVQVDVDGDNNRVNVTIDFRILNTQTAQTIELALERTR
jgi:phage baseplate assembly protein W